MVGAALWTPSQRDLYFIWTQFSLGAAWLLAGSEASFIQADLTPAFLFSEEVNGTTKGTKKGEARQRNRWLLNEEELRPRPSEN